MDPHTDEHAHPAVPYRLYVNVWLGLVALTAVTVTAAYANLGHMAVFTAVLIAGVKVTLVLLYFMHLRFERRLYTYMILSVIATYVVFVILTFADYSFR
jgi:cytochrome c oxidase subunit 4